MQGPPNYRPRIGTFLILVGGGFLTLFILMLAAGSFQVVYLLLGAPLLFLGFRVRGKPAQPKSGRFAIINKSREAAKKRKEAAEKKRQEKEAAKKKK